MRALAAAVFLVAFGWIGAAPASECAAPHRQCLAQCDRDFPPQRDTMGHAGCFARCGWDQATCEARRAVDETQAALDRAKPWIDEQSKSWQRFLDGFRQGGTGVPAPQRSIPTPRPEPAPEPGSRRSTPL